MPVAKNHLLVHYVLKGKDIPKYGLKNHKKKKLKYLFSILGKKIPSLQFMCKKTIVNCIEFPHYMRSLPLPDAIKTDLENNYPEYIDFSPVKLSMISKEADYFLNIEKRIKYSQPLCKNFFNVLAGNSWIEDMFGNSTLVTKHFVIRNFILAGRVNQDELLSGMCVTCFIHSRYFGAPDVLMELKHLRFRGTSRELFQKMFQIRNWCSSCRKTPLYDMYDPTDCRKKFGAFLHDCCNFGGCFACYGGERLFKVWYEDDFSDYFYY